MKIMIRRILAVSSIVTIALAIVTAGIAGAPQAPAPQALTIDLPKIHEQVDHFWLQKLKIKSENNQPGRNSQCPADLSGCVSEVCARLGGFGCNSQSEVLNVLRDCRGNYSGDCLKAVCEKLGRYDCDDMSEMGPLLIACQGNIDGGCVRTVCSKLGTFGCSHANDVISVARACGGSL